MSGFFALVWLAANVAMVVFIIKAVKEKDAVEKKKNRKIWLICLAVAFVSLLIVGVTTDSSDSGNEKSENQSSIEKSEETVSDTHIYDSAEIVDLMNGTGTSKIGTISVVKAKQSECTEEALADWFFNYVKKNSDCNYHIIVYTDVDGKGVYALGSGLFIQKDVNLTDNGDGTYSTGDDAGSTYYTVNEDTQTLSVQTVMVDDSVVDSVKNKVDAVIPEEYKKNEGYAVDIAGEEGNLDCNLTLVSEDFSKADCQKIAVELASKIKELDLGVGYFCISFQTDEYTIKALSSLDDLNTQDASEMKTKDF